LAVRALRVPARKRLRGHWALRVLLAVRLLALRA